LQLSGWVLFDIQNGIHSKRLIIKYFYIDLFFTMHQSKTNKGITVKILSPLYPLPNTSSAFPEATDIISLL
jgi:hypothetical protein